MNHFEPRVRPGATRHTGAPLPPPRRWRRKGRRRTSGREREALGRDVGEVRSKRGFLGGESTPWESWELDAGGSAESNRAARWCEPSKFLQSQHLQFSLHRMPAWKHSQYFFKHPDFLQLHPLLCLPAAGSSSCAHRNGGGVVLGRMMKRARRTRKAAPVPVIRGRVIVGSIPETHFDCGKDAASQDEGCELCKRTPSAERRFIKCPASYA